MRVKLSAEMAAIDWGTVSMAEGDTPGLELCSTVSTSVFHSLH
jgi:hypothetical protein